MMTVEQCSQCAGSCAVAGSADALARPDLPALAREGDGRPVCDGCVALRTRWAIADGRPAFAYVNADATAITSWGGAHIARIVRRSTFRSNFGATMLAWTAELPNGVRCYGRNGGRSMATNVRTSRRSVTA